MREGVDVEFKELDRVKGTLPDSIPKEIIGAGEGMVKGLAIENVKTGTASQLDVTGVFIATGNG